MTRLDRSRKAFDDFGGDPNMWADAGGAWMRAVEWYENRPADGETNGERLHWCVRKFAPRGAVSCQWDSDPGQRRWESAAQGLVRCAG